RETALQMVAPQKGILAADESIASTKKRLDMVGLPNTEDNRRLFRDLLLATDGIEKYLSGVILHDETFRQEALDGELFPQKLVKKGVLPGIKVDKGTVDFNGFSGEVLTEGLDGLP